MSYAAHRLDLLAQWNAFKPRLAADATLRPPKPLMDSTSSFLPAGEAAIKMQLQTIAANYDAGDAEGGPPIPLTAATVDATIAALEAMPPEPAAAEAAAPEGTPPA